MKIAVYSAFLLIALGGCHLGPRYCVPESPVPEEWKTPAGDTACGPAVENWWDVFGDPTLSDLQNKAVLNNPDVFIALERVNEARAEAGVQKANLFPQVSMDPAYVNLENLIKLYGVPGTLIPGFQQIVRVHEMEYVLPLNVTYELDLWQKYRGKYRSAQIDAQARMEALRSSLLTVTTDLASNYFNMRAVDTQVDLLENTIALLKKALELRLSRYQAGLDSYLAYLNAEQQLKNAEADYQDTIRQRSLFENAIAILIGEPASYFHIEPNPLQTLPPVIPAGLPSTIMIKRPDIAEAERKMASVHALIGVAYASFFPAIGMTAGLGFLSPDFKHFLHWKSRFWDLAAGMFQSIFDGGRNRSNLAAAKARFKEAEGNYKKTVLNAFQEVEDALVNIERQTNQGEELDYSTLAAEKASLLSYQRYVKGVANYLEFIDYKTTQLAARRSRMNVLGMQHQSTVQLIKSLGGCWDTAKPSEECCLLDAPVEEESGAAKSE